MAHSGSAALAEVVDFGQGWTSADGAERSKARSHRLSGEE
jgi:hypothetical protein